MRLIPPKPTCMVGPCLQGGCYPWLSQSHCGDGIRTYIDFSPLPSYFFRTLCLEHIPSAAVLSVYFPHCQQRVHDESKQVPVQGVSHPVCTAVATTRHDTVMVLNPLPGWSLGLSPLGGEKRSFTKTDGNSGAQREAMMSRQPYKPDKEIWGTPD